MSTVKIQMVLVLLVRRSRHLTRNIRSFRAKGILNISGIFHKLGEQLALALPGFHAISGADVTGSFSGKGKGNAGKHKESATIMFYKGSKL